jgi:hypothetical protein
VDSPAQFEMITQQSAWYGAQAHRARFRYMLMKGTQILLAAAIPVIAVSSPSNKQRWASAILGSLIGVIEGLIQLGQYQQNWLLYRATRQALKREEFLHRAKAGPYSGASDADTLYVERCDAVMSGETTKWLASQEQAAATKQST